MRDWGRILLRLTPSRQCMLKSIHVTTDWHISHVFMVQTQSSILWQMSSYFVSIDSYQHRRLSRFVIYVLKMNLCKLGFSLNFWICACERSYFWYPHMSKCTKMCKMCQFSVTLMKNINTFNYKFSQEAQRLYAELLLFLFCILYVWMSFVLFL